MNVLALTLKQSEYLYNKQQWNKALLIKIYHNNFKISIDNNKTKIRIIKIITLKRIKNAKVKGYFQDK